MDNASKALIMVGGILITIMVISLTMYLFTNARGVANASDERLMISQINAFNRFFIHYPSEITGLDVYNIIGKINDINRDAYALGSVTSNISSVSKDIEDYVDTYRYECKDENADGLIDHVYFTFLVDNHPGT